MSTKTIHAGTHEPIHSWFELTYANYLAIPRSILQSMPQEWQARFVQCLEELDETFEWRRSGCHVDFRTRKGKFMHDELVDYDRGRRTLTPQNVAEISDRHSTAFEGRNP